MPVCKPRDGITHELVRELFHYDPETGIVTNRINRGNKAVSGTRAGWINKGKNQGYRVIEIYGVAVREANLIWLWVTGDWPIQEIDHKNKVRDDNRWDNLRLADGSQQKMNSTIYVNNTTGYRGVVKRKNRKNTWEAWISIDKKNTRLGYFKSPEAASVAYEEARRKHFGEFA